MQKCKVCSATEFDKVDGYFFCKRCHTQNEDIREEVLELRVDSTVRLRKQKIRTLKSGKSGDTLGWTSWELYNFVLIGLTDELIGLGVPQDIKLTILQLWATYLKKIEVAFISTKKKCVPKLARRYNKRDAEIIYGKVKSQKRSRKRKRLGSSASTSMISEYMSDGSSMRELNKNKKLLIAAEYDRFMQSQASSEGDAVSSFSQSLYSIKSSSAKSSDNEEKIRFNDGAISEAKKVKKLSKRLPRSKRVKYRRKHVTTQYKMGPQIITPMKLWAIIYIALRIHDEPMHLGDMLRYGREGHLSYYRLDHLLPVEVSITKSDMKLLSQHTELTHKGMRRLAASMAKFLGVFEIFCPDMTSLVGRYCQELELPRGVSLYTERFITLSPPIMEFNAKSPYIPNYEGRAMAFVIVVLKMLFSLDGITEYEISQIAERINSVGSERGVLDSKLFSFREWQGYIEYRRTVLTQSHFPTRLKYQQEPQAGGSLYIKFLESVRAKSGDREEPEVTNHKHLIPSDLANAMKQCIANLNYNNVPLKEADVFAPSLTPLYSYIRQLMQHPLRSLPPIFETDFFFTKVGYITKLEHLQKLAAQCDIHLEVIESNLHFLERIVPQFEQIRISSVEELKTDVKVYDNVDAKTEAVETEDFNDYGQWNVPCKVRLNLLKESYYSDIRKSRLYSRDCKSGNYDNFEFDATTPTGKLLIPNDSDSDSENCADHTDATLDKESALLRANICKKYNLQLSNYERDSMETVETIDEKHFSYLRKRKRKLYRDPKGRFVQKTRAERVLKNSDPSSLDMFNETSLEKQDPLAPFKAETFLADLERECSFLKADLKDFSMNDVDFLDLSNISTFDESGIYNEISKSLFTNLTDDRSSEFYKNSDHVCRFFRPFKNYWVYHCVFSRVKPKNFELFEKVLPISFRWLLNECAGVMEMAVDDLYEEVCLIESYHAHVFERNDSTAANESATDADTAANRNTILNAPMNLHTGATAVDTEAIGNQKIS